MCNFSEFDRQDRKDRHNESDGRPRSALYIRRSLFQTGLNQSHGSANLPFAKSTRRERTSYRHQSAT
jgi:hypothetical protein